MASQMRWLIMLAQQASDSSSTVRPVAGESTWPATGSVNLGA